MLRALRLAVAIAILAAPAVPAGAGDACLLCGGAGSTGGGTGSAIGGGDARPPIDIEMSAGFNFRRFTLPGAGGLIVEAKGWSGEGGGDYALVGDVVIRGAPHAQVHVLLPDSVELVSRSGDRVRVDRITSNLPRDPQLDANGRLGFSFAAPVVFPAGMRPGDYRASFSVEATYD